MYGSGGPQQQNYGNSNPLGGAFGGAQIQAANTKDVNYFMHKRIVVTGASSGIGQALAYWYLNQGAYVILVGKDEKSLKNCAS